MTAGGPAEAPAATDSGTRGGPWRKTLAGAAIASIIGTLLIFVFAGFIPPLVVFIVLWIVGLVLLGRKTKPAAILMLVTFVVSIALSLPFTIPTLAVPASAGDFILTVFTLVVALVGAVAAVAVLTRRDERAESSPRALVGISVAVIAVAAVVGIVATVTFEDDQPREGDIRLVAQDLEFSEESLSGDEGTVSVFVNNEDLTLHTFTIDELDVDVDIPAGKGVRVTFEAEKGSFEFYCRPHEAEMKGKLDVE